MLQVISILGYLVLLTNLGLFICKRFQWNTSDTCFGSLGLGMLVASLYYFLVSHMKILTLQAHIGLLFVLLFFLVINFFSLLHYFTQFATWIKNIYSKNVSIHYWFILLVILIIYFVDASTPARSADAMRYHLPQLEDLKINHGFIFRPYLGYNLPIFFSYLMSPLYYLFGEMGIKFSMPIFLILLSFVLIRLSQLFDLKKSPLLVLFFILLPINILQGTTINNDLPLTLILSISLVFLTENLNERKKSLEIFSFLFFGFAVGMKYQAALFFPVLLSFYSPYFVNSQHKLKEYLYLMFLCLISGLPFLPHLIQNIYYTQNPLWPMFTSLFPGKNLALDHMAKEISQNNSGAFTFENLFFSLKRLLTYIQIPGLLWPLFLLGITQLKKFKKLAFYSLIGFFIFWVTFQPIIYPRFAIIFLPLLITVSFAGLQYIKTKKPRVYFIGLSTYFILGLIFISFYSKDFFIYIKSKDLTQYHRATWYQHDYQWMNKNLPIDSKILIITLSNFYGIKRDFVRADPGLAALISWPKMENVNTFRDFLKKEKISHIYIDTGYLSNKNFPQILKNIKFILDEKEGDLIKESEVKLYRSRIFNQFTKTKSWLIKLNPSYSSS